MIRMEALTRRFGAVLAVDRLTLEIAQGEVFGLLGPNGAGKTTTLRMLAGLIGITAGTAVVDGLDLGDARQATQVRERLGLLPEENGLYGDLSPAETLDFYARLHHVRNRKVVIDDLLARLSLLERRDSPVSTLSKGMKQRLAIARALVNSPRLVMLDEPTANLDPQASLEVRELLDELRHRGTTVIVNTHRLEEAERMCDRIGILRTRLLHVARPSDLASPGRWVRVRLERIDAEQRAVIDGLSLECTEEGAGVVRMRIADGADVADVVAALVREGGRVREVVQERPTLESIYLAAVHGAA